MIALFDIDSMFYLSVYKVISFGEIRALYGNGYSREDITKEIIDSALHRLENTSMQIFEDIEATGWQIDEIEYYVTDCGKSKRKEITPEYKANRKRNKWVSLVRKQFIDQTYNCFKSDEWEADDLIADRVRELNESEYIILTIDKDVKKLPGFHYDYYRPRSKEDEPIKARRGLGYTSKLDHRRFFAFQMLVGDSGDNIKGIKGIGEKNTHVKELSELRGFSLARKVVNLYEDKSSKEELRKNFRLIKLGK